MRGVGSAYVVTPGMQTVAAAIQQQEGYAPGTLAYTNNNPGNLIYAGQPGATPGAGGFASFPTYQDGLNALYNQINLYATGACGVCGGQPMTIGQMTAVYAPAGQGGNNPGLYAQNIANATGATPDTPLSSVIGGSAVASTGTAPFVGPIDPSSSLPSLDLSADTGAGTGADSTMDDGSDSSSTDNTGLYIAAAAVGILGLMIATR